MAALNGALTGLSRHFLTIAICVHVVMTRIFFAVRTPFTLASPPSFTALSPAHMASFPYVLGWVRYGCPILVLADL